MSHDRPTRTTQIQNKLSVIESLITLKQPLRNMRGRQNHSLEIGPEPLYMKLILYFPSDVFSFREKIRKTQWTLTLGSKADMNQADLAIFLP